MISRGRRRRQIVVVCRSTTQTVDCIWFFFYFFNIAITLFTVSVPNWFYFSSRPHSSIALCTNMWMAVTESRCQLFDFFDLFGLSIWDGRELNISMQRPLLLWTFWMSWLITIIVIRQWQDHVFLVVFFSSTRKDYIKCLYKWQCGFWGFFGEKKTKIDKSKSQSVNHF
jgi:hypothetical protein